MCLHCIWILRYKPPNISTFVLMYSVILVSITNNNIFGSASSVSLTCSNSQLNPEIMANGQARPCSLINPICSPGYYIFLPYLAFMTGKERFYIVLAFNQ